MIGIDGNSPGASSAPPPASTPAVPPAAAPSDASAAPASTAVTDALEARDFNAFRSATRGERAGRPLPPATRSSTPPPPAGTPAASTGAPPQSPASEPGAHPGGHGGNAETRIKSLVAETKRLEAELASARGGNPAQPRTTSTAAPSAAAPAPAVTDPQPTPNDVAKYPEGQYDPKYITDLGAWGARQETRRLSAEADARTRAEAETASTRERYQGFTARIDAAKTADPTFVSTLSPDVLALRPLSSMTAAEKSQLAMNGGTATLAAAAVMEEVIGSEVSAELLSHFSTHPEELARLTALHPRQMLREFGGLESRFKKTPAAAAAAAPPSEPITSAAPPPPAQLGGRPATPVDPIRAAVVSQDFQAFRSAAKAERAAGRI